MPHANFNKSINYLDNLKYDLGIKPGLENITKILELLNNPQDNFKSIHVGGTNGKGSTAAMIFSSLAQSGYSTGLYLSPHIFEIRERITVNGKKITREIFAFHFDRIRKLSDNYDIKLTFFEYITAIAYDYFSSTGVDFAVVEVGMGGRLDATNVLSPAVSVISSISLDHQRFLGSTLSDIAYEKLGIVKDGGILISGVDDPQIFNIIENFCNEKAVTLFSAGRDIYVKGNNAGWDFEKGGGNFMQDFTLKSNITGELYHIRIPLLGEHQVRNACCATAALECLSAGGSPGIKLNKDKILEGLEKVKHPGRFEFILNQKDKPMVVVDGAHNPEAMQCLGKTLVYLMNLLDKNSCLILILGLNKYKAVKDILEIITPLADTIILTRSKHDSAELPGNLYNYLNEINSEMVKNKRVILSKSIGSALKDAFKIAGAGDVICVAGSLFNISEAYEAVGVEREG